MIVEANNLTDALYNVCHTMLTTEADELGWIKGTPCVYDNMVRADSMEYDLDVGRDLWLTNRRFPKLTYDYIDFDAYEDFLARCEYIYNGAAKRGVITTMACRQHGKRYGLNSVQYAHGNCLLAFTFRGGKGAAQPTLGMHSRVAYPGYMGAMDLCLAYVIAGEIAERVGAIREDFGFTWFSDSFQWRGMYELAYMYSVGLDKFIDLEDTHLDDDYPCIAKSRRELRYFQRTTVDQQKFAVRERFKRRFDRHVAGDYMDRVPVDSLNLDGLRRRARRGRV